MSRYTPLARLPGHYAGFFDDERVVCSWKAYPNYTLLCFFEAPNADAQTGQCRNLLFLELSWVFDGPEVAKEIARQAWAKYKDRILTGDGERIPVVWSFKEIGKGLSAPIDDLVLMIEEDRRTVEAFLDLLADDIERYPERLRPLDPALVASMRELVAGVETNLDAPLPQEDYVEKLDSVRQGLAEIAAGFGESVTEDDSYFADLCHDVRRLAALRQALIEGEESGCADDFTLDDIIRELDEEDKQT